MDIKISFRHMDSSSAIDEMIHTKVAKLKKYFNGKMYVKWTCSVDKNVHESDVHITGDHFEFYAKAQDENLYKTIDDVLEKLDKQLEKRKSQNKDHIHNKHTK